MATSFLPAFCFSVNVAGEFAEVENLLPGSVSPHDFQLAPKDLRKLAAADLLVVNGLNLEAWLNRVLKAARRDKPMTVVAASAGMSPELIYEGTESQVRPSRAAQPGRDPAESGRGGNPNPHIWLDPRLACFAVTNIMEALQKADPVHAEGYARNGAAYIHRLKQLDGEIRHALAFRNHKAIVTFHNAFPYFARRYGLHLVGVIEETPDVSPSPRYLADLMRSMREKQVKVIFTERQSSARLATQMAQDLQITVAELDTLETGPLVPGAYEEGMRRNIEIILKVLP